MRMFTSRSDEKGNLEVINYLHFALQVLTSNSLRRGSHHIPHSSGLVGTYLKALQGQLRQDVLIFLAPIFLLCSAKRCPQKHLDLDPALKHSIFLEGQ